MRSLTRFVVLALLAWLPLQAAALPGLMTLCELDPAGSPMHLATHDAGAAAGHHDHDDHAHGDEEAGTGGHDGHSGQSPGGHGCCHHYSTATPAPAIAASDAGTTVLLMPSPSLSDFFPEQPKRPPLASL
jgi:hypothetical protein